MATSTTWGTFRQRLLSRMSKKYGQLIANGNVSAMAAGSVTLIDPDVRNTNLGTNHFRNMNTVIYRPGAASSADYVRYAGDLTNSSGLLAHTGGNYSDTTVGTEVVELWHHGIRPDTDIMSAGNRALEKCFFFSFLALSHLSDQDGGMEASTDTSWTDVGTPGTSSKSTTARRTPYGLRSYNLINGSANEGTQSATIPVMELDSIRAFGISSCNVSTASLRPYDVTNSASFTNAAITHDEEEPMLMCVPWENTPTDCKEMALRLIGTGASADIFWNMVWVYKRSNLKVNLPAYANEGYKIPEIFQGIPRQAHPSSANVYAAQSIEMVRLEEGVHYMLVMDQPDANPHAVIFRDASIFDWPLFVRIKRPYSDLVTFDEDSDTTTCPVNVFMPKFTKEVLDTVYIPRFPSEPATTFMRVSAEQDDNRAEASRPPKKLSRPEYYATPRI